MLENYYKYFNKENIKFVFSLISSISSIAIIIAALSYWHQIELERSTLRVGEIEVTTNSLNMTVFRIPVVNSYDSRYPSDIIWVNGELKDKNINWFTSNTNLFVERDKPTYIDITVFNMSNPEEIENYMKIKDINRESLFVDDEPLIEGYNNLTVTIYYFDYSRMGLYAIDTKYIFIVPFGGIGKPFQPTFFWFSPGEERIASSGPGWSASPFDKFQIIRSN